MQSAEKDTSNSQKEVEKAAEHISKLAERVKKAEAGQIEAQNKLASAGVETSTARKLVEAVSCTAVCCYMIAGISCCPVLSLKGFVCTDITQTCLVW